MALRSAPLRAHRLLLAFIALLGGATSLQAAAPIFNEVHTIAGPTVAVPQEYTFSVSLAGDYSITLTDLGAALTPSAPLQSVELAVTSSTDTLVGAPLVGAGTLTLTALAVGNYTIHVIGLPGDTPGSGPFGVAVDNSSMTSIATFQGVLALPSGALPSGLAVWSDTFTPQSGGNYTVALNDLQLPQSLSQLGLLLIPQGGTTITQTLPVAGSPTPNQATVALTAGVTYSIIFFAQASPGSGGLLSATVTPGGGGSPIYGKALAAGTTTSLGSPGLAAGSASFTLTDLKYPAALAQVGGVLVLNGQPVATLTAAGSQALPGIVAGTYQVFAAGTAAAAAPGAGSFAVQVTQGGVPAFGTARGVTGSGGSLTPYSFDTTIAAAGKYAVSLTDFRFPVVLNSLGLVAVQAGAPLGSPLTGAGDLNITAAAGPLTLLVFAQAAPGGGLFGIDTTPLAGGASVFSVTQGVGGVFSARQFSITTAGTYAVTATDLGFPATFANFDTIVTQGTTQLGQIFGGGTFVINATAGNYFINFVAQPTGSADAGTYALTVSSAPPAPVVSLSTDNSTVSSGSTVDIIWSSQNATSCQASGGSGFTGPQATSGTITSSALTTTITFTLACTGTGGTTQKSVTVTVTAPASGGHSGSADGVLLALLAVLMAWRALWPWPPRTLRSVSRVGRLP